MFHLAQFSGEAHCPETDLLTQCPTQVPRDQHGIPVSPHVARTKVMLQWQGEQDKEYKVQNRKGTASQVGCEFMPVYSFF